MFYGHGGLPLHFYPFLAQTANICFSNEPCRFYVPGVGPGSVRPRDGRGGQVQLIRPERGARPDPDPVQRQDRHPHPEHHDLQQVQHQRPELRRHSGRGWGTHRLGRGKKLLY